VSLASRQGECEKPGISSGIFCWPPGAWTGKWGSAVRHSATPNIVITVGCKLFKSFIIVSDFILFFKKGRKI